MLFGAAHTYIADIGKYLPLPLPPGGMCRSVVNFLREFKFFWAIER